MKFKIGENCNLDTNPQWFIRVSSEKLCMRVYLIFFSFQVSYGKKHACLQTYILNADQFPSLFPQLVQFFLHILYSWVLFSFMSIYMNLGLQGENNIFPFYQYIPSQLFSLKTNQLSLLYLTIVASALKGPIFVILTFI